MLGLAEATFAAGDFSRAVVDHVKKKTPVRLTVHSDNIAGVHLPVFTLRHEEDNSDDNSLLGLTGGGSAINKAREKFTKFLKVLVTVASLQTQFVTLDQVIKVTNRRVNALEFVVIPRIKYTIDYIDKELDEESREDFFRLKKVVEAKKQRQAEKYAAGDKKEKAHDENAIEEVMIEEQDAFEDDDEDVFI